jgi:DNA-binding HxlR family transcriptional regulator
MDNKKTNRSNCPVSHSLDIFGDKWSLLIIRDIMLNNRNTYGELLKMEENIATNILADRLVKLEASGIIKKEAYTKGKMKFFYSLTPMGIDLSPTILEIIFWGSKYFDISSNAKALVARASADKQEYIKRLSAKLKNTKP